MPSPGRMFLCAACRAQVLVCTACDRGQIYCAGPCAAIARCHSLRAAGRRYQHSRRGRFKHAERTRRWRLRAKNVTHQGSMPLAQDALLAANSALRTPPPSSVRPPAWHCHFCGARCPAWVRQGFLHSARVVSLVQPDRQGSRREPFP